MPRDTATINHERLTLAQDRFVQAWGQMGPSWGISRTMAEVHALLFIVGGPLNTDEVMERLRISRGNASMTLRSLLEWGIVSRVHKRGDRKEYFEAEQDVWALARKIMRERLRREILPTLTTLHEIRDLTGPAASASGPDRVLSVELARHNERLDAMLELITTLDRLAERFVGSEGPGLKAAAKLLSKIV